MKYKVVLTTVADLSIEVEADDEDAAVDVALERAKEFANQVHGAHDYTVSINDEWQLRDPEVTTL